MYNLWTLKIVSKVTEIKALAYLTQFWWCLWHKFFNKLLFIDKIFKKILSLQFFSLFLCTPEKINNGAWKPCTPEKINNGALKTSLGLFVLLIVAEIQSIKNINIFEKCVFSVTPIQSSYFNGISLFFLKFLTLFNKK